MHLSPPEFPLQAPTHTRQLLPSVVSARGPGPPTQDSAVTATLPQTALETLASALSSPSRPHSPHSCHRPRALLCLLQNMSKSLKKLVEESREKNQPEVDMSDRGISSMLDVNGLCKFSDGC